MTDRLIEREKNGWNNDIIFHHNMFLISVSKEWDKKLEYFQKVIGYIKRKGKTILDVYSMVNQIEFYYVLMIVLTQN